MKRPITLLLLGVIVGYYAGYQDAQRGARALGARVAAMLNRVNPDSVRIRQQQQQDAMRDRIHAQSAGSIEP